MLSPQTKSKLHDKIKIAKEQCLKELPACIRDHVAEHGYLAGGCFASIATGEKPKDYDIFLRKCDHKFMENLTFFFQEVLDDDRPCFFPKCTANIITAIKLSRYHDDTLQNGGVVDLSAKTNRITSMSRRALTFRKSQLIIGFIGEPHDILDDFDFEHCMVFSDFSDDQIYFLGDSERSISTKYLQIHHVEQVLAMTFRMQKMITRGWYVDDDTLKQAETMLREIKLTDRSEFLRHVAGAYV